MEDAVATDSAANAALQCKPKAKAKSHSRKLQAEELAGLVIEASECMSAHKEGVEALKQQRSAKIAEKRALSKQIRKEKKTQVKKDKVIAKRSTWTLVAELERRMAAQPVAEESAHPES